MKYLISTAGPDPENTLAAMRALPYEKLVLVVSEDTLNSGAFRKIEEVEKRAKGSVDSIMVDEYDLQDCFRDIMGYILQHSSEDSKNTFSINISGGTKIMGDASLLVAFQMGIPAYQCEKANFIRFPVITGVSLRDRLTRSEIRVLKEVGMRDTIDDIARKLGQTITGETLRKSLRRLRRLGVMKIVPSEGEIVLELTEPGIFVLEILNRFDRDSREKPA